MKKNIIKAISLFVLSLIAVEASAQMKYFEGKININNATPVANYGFRADNWQGMYLTCKDGNFFQVDVSPQNPRIAGTFDEVVFYNTQTRTFNSIQVADVYNLSDMRAKENIEPLTFGLNTIQNLRPVSYKWKKNEVAEKNNAEYAENDTTLQLAYGPNDNKTQYGFLAQEVEAVMPDAVLTNEDGHKMINYTAIIPVLVQAVQELQAKVETQALQIEQLSKEKGISKSLSVVDNKIVSCSPNPTDGKITIVTSLTNDTENAKLVISSLDGNNDVQFVVSYASPTVSADISSLKSGIHIVSLYVNDKLVDSQRIVKQ